MGMHRLFIGILIMIRTCKGCQKEFKSKSKRQVYCTTICRDLYKHPEPVKFLVSDLTWMVNSGLDSAEIAVKLNVSRQSVEYWAKRLKLDLVPSKIKQETNSRVGNRSQYWKGYGGIGKRYWHSILKCAEKREILFTITIEDAWNQYLKQDGKCALTNVQLNLECDKHKGDFYWTEMNASLDRIDSSKGYTIDNIQWVQKKINIIKNTLTQEEFIDLCKLVAHNFT
jgi:hypothetical protein